MNKQYFIKLLHRYAKKELTFDEREYVDLSYKLFENETDVFNSIAVKEKGEIKNEIQGTIWRNISEREQSTKKERFAIKKFALLAAAVIILFVAITGLFFLLEKSPKEQLLTTTFLAPNTNNENSIIFLPDSSTVILSPGSKLHYPPSFSNLNRREVFLEGQAFFDIKHNALQPFVVRAGKLETIVLGTAFNVKAIPAEKDITITVERGKVKVSDSENVLGVISQNQEICYDKQKLSSVTKVINTQNSLSWKNEELVFDDVTIIEATKFLEERYKVKILVNDQALNSLRFTASFSKNQNFERALHTICEFNRLAYKYDKEKSTVTITNN